MNDTISAVEVGFLHRLVRPHNMAFVLSAERDPDDCDHRVLWQTYAEYLRKNEAAFPPGAYALATSNWYFGNEDHRAPHDAWLESAVFEEPSTGARNELRHLSLRVRLLGAYHDQYLEFFYPRVYSYALSYPDTDGGHFDWRYDEFRLSESGRLIHEIEWAGFKSGGRWLLEVSDVQFSVTPRDAV